MITMKDYRGRDLKVGDLVLFIYDRSKTCFMAGTITEISDNWGESVSCTVEYMENPKDKNSKGFYSGLTQSKVIKYI